MNTWGVVTTLPDIPLNRWNRWNRGERRELFFAFNRLLTKSAFIWANAGMKEHEPP
jgi:hypothetical protein